MSSTSKERYEPPSLTSVQQLIEVCFAQEGNIYRRFNKLADNLGDMLDALVAMQVQINGMSEELDKVMAQANRIGLIVDALEEKDGEIQGQG